MNSRRIVQNRGRRDRRPRRTAVGKRIDVRDDELVEALASVTAARIERDVVG